MLLSVARDIGRDLYGEISGRYEDILRGQQTALPSGPALFHDYDRDVTLRLTWEAYRNFRASAEAGFRRAPEIANTTASGLHCGSDTRSELPWSEQLQPPAQQMLEEHGRYASASPCNAMTVDVEEYFQVAAFERTIPRGGLGGHYPSRVEFNTGRVLDLSPSTASRAPFSPGLGCRTASRLVARIVDDGHELASHGYDHTRLHQFMAEQFRADVIRTKAMLEDLSAAGRARLPRAELFDRRAQPVGARCAAGSRLRLQLEHLSDQPRPLRHAGGAALSPSG